MYISWPPDECKAVRAHSIDTYLFDARQLVFSIYPRFALKGLYKNNVSKLTLGKGWYSPAERGKKVEVEYVQTFIAVS